LKSGKKEVEGAKRQVDLGMQIPNRPKNCVSYMGKGTKSGKGGMGVNESQYAVTNEGGDMQIWRVWQVKVLPNFGFVSMKRMEGRGDY